MGLFTLNKNQKFDFFEENIIDRNFLNLHKYFKNFEFDQRSRTDKHVEHPGEHLDYDFLINQRRVRFSCTKIIIKNFKLYENYFETYKATKTDKGYIGLPNLSDMRTADALFPLSILELRSIALIKEKYLGKSRERFINTSNEYFLWLHYDKELFWVDELKKDFNYIADKLILETAKNLSKLKKFV